MRNIFLIILGLLILNTAVLADGNPEQFKAKYYDNAKVLRIKFVKGEAFVKRSYDEGYEEASINLPVFENDRVGTTEGRLEVYLGRLNYLRMDFDTEVEFPRVPELRKTAMAVRILRGGIYLDVSNLDYERDIEIQTPDCGVFLLDKGIYRINVTEGGGTEVYVHEGLTEVSGESYSRNVREDQKIVMANGDIRERPFYFQASHNDGFDRWNDKRNNAVGYARYSTPRYLSRGYEDYEYELSRSGRWVYHNSYREYIWMPYNLSIGWSPYYHGRWVWNPHYGYVWTSYDTWGYFTHHYGRWHWDNYHGWHWLPGYHWSPAWVYWGWDDHHWGWCPLSRWNRPIVILNNRWMRNYRYRRHGIPLRARSTVVIRKKHLHNPHINRVAVRKGKITKKSIVSKGFAPAIKPSYGKVHVVTAKGNKVTFKDGGFLGNNKKYKMMQKASTSAVSKAPPVYKYSGVVKSGSKAKVYKYSAGSKSPGSPGTLHNTVKSKTYLKSGSSKSYKSSAGSGGKTYKPSSGSLSSGVKSGGYKSKYSKSTTKRSTPSKRSSGYKSSSTVKRKSSSSGSKKSSSSSKSSKAKKKKKEPGYYSSSNYSYSPGGGKTSAPSAYGSSSYASRQKASPSYKSYKSYKSKKSSSSSSYKSSKPSYDYQYRNESNKSTSPKSSYKSYKSYGSSSKSYKPYKPSNSEKKSYSSSGSSYKSYKPSYKSSSGSSYKSYKPSYKSSSGSSYKSYKPSYKPSYKSSGSSYKSSSRSYSKSSRSHSKSSGSSSGSSSKSAKRKK